MNYQITGMKPFRIAHGNRPDNIHVTISAWETKSEAEIYGRLVFGSATPWWIVEVERTSENIQKSV